MADPAPLSFKTRGGGGGLGGVAYKDRARPPPRGHPLNGTSLQSGAGRRNNANGCEKRSALSEQELTVFMLSGGLSAYNTWFTVGGRDALREGAPSLSECLFFFDFSIWKMQ